MKTLKILCSFLVCCAVSAVLLILSYSFIAGRAVGCAMSLGCSGQSTGLLSLVAIFGLLLPLAIFPAGAIFTSRHLIEPSNAHRTLLHVFAIFPLLALAATPVCIAVLDTAAGWSDRPYRERIRQIDAELKKTPIEVSVIKARSTKGVGDYRDIEFTIQVKNVPQLVQTYEIGLRGLRFEHPIAGINQEETSDYTPVIRAVNTNGKWEFQADESRRVLTSGEDQFVAKVRYLHAGGRLLPIEPLEPPSALEMRLGYWREKQWGYPDIDIFNRFVPIDGFESVKL